jgi:HSP20 family molecular chaperone IbpA
LPPDEIAITAEQNVLTVEGRKAEKAEPCLVPGVPDAWT